MILHNAQGSLTSWAGERVRHHGPVALVLHPVRLWWVALLLIRPLLWLGLEPAAQVVADRTGQLAALLYRRRP
ncbi:MAG: hypothetical protein LT106_09425 [Burkholderiaceae bacterium]|nr:hypothetical protein [Burkholderiaceae bacterium]